MGKKKAYNTVEVKDRPTWIKENIDFISKQKYRDILRFYIINTPDADRSVRGRTFSDLGLDEEEILVKLKEDVPDWKCSGNGILVKSHLEEVELITFPPSEADLKERICFSHHNNQKTELEGLFGHIRNSLAHGRFNIVGPNNNPVLVMEDVNQTNNNCSARMVIEMNTLLRWQQIIENK